MNSMNVKIDGLKKTSDAAMISTVFVDNGMCFERYERRSPESPQMDL